MQTQASSTPKAVEDEYHELFHYTSAAGLKGILETQSLWASHALHQNDAEEIKLFFDRRLTTIIEEELSAVSTAENQGSIKATAVQFKDSIKKVTLAFNQPYIFSMCGTNDGRIAEHGLLSQWRGYGKEGGYALVFETGGFKQQLGRERDRFHYQSMQWANVYYHDEKSANQRVAPEIFQAEMALRAGIREFASNPGEDVMQSTYEAVTTLSCLYKHWGFAEEHEIRVVAIPAHSSVRNAASLDGKPAKPQRTFIRSGCPIPYIELLAPPTRASPKELLPIRRIIVGPHRDKEQRRDAVQLIIDEVGIQAEVTISEIPYIGS